MTNHVNHHHHYHHHTLDNDQHDDDDHHNHHLDNEMAAPLQWGTFFIKKKCLLPFGLETHLHLEPMVTIFLSSCFFPITTNFFSFIFRIYILFSGMRRVGTAGDDNEGPNDAGRVIWALGEFSFISPF
jgi:hypothetical protein